LKKQSSSEEGASTPDLSDNLDEEQEVSHHGMHLSNSEGVQNRAAAYKELNANCSSKHNISNFLEGVDLRPLTRNLLPESQLKDVDVDITWNWDVLFAEMVPEFILHHH